MFIQIAGEEILFIQIAILVLYYPAILAVIWLVYNQLIKELIT